MLLSATLAVPPDWQPIDPITQEYSLSMPLGYAPEPFAVPPRVAVILHAFHMALVPEFHAYLNQLPVAADLFISTDSARKRAALMTEFDDWTKGTVDIRVFPNRGRDVAPKLVGFGFAHRLYDLVLHLHTKQSVHESGLAGWRPFLLETLLGSPETVLSILEIFRQAPRIGLLAPQHIDMLRPWIRWGENFDLAEQLAQRMGIAVSAHAPLDFASGSMFWARPAALAPLLDLGLTFEDFPEEGGQIDGTLAHAIERLYLHACERAGFDWMKIAARGFLHDERGIVSASGPLGLRRFVSRTTIRLQRHEAADEPQLSSDPQHLRMPLRPKRPPHILWRDALGDRQSGEGKLAVIPHDQSQESGAMAAAFTEASADMVLLLGEPGLLHPDAATALLQMSAAQHGRAILVPARLPDPHPPAADPASFSLNSLDGQIIAIPRAAYAAIGVPVATSSLRSYVLQAAGTGFSLRLCPRALFFPTHPADARSGEIVMTRGLDVILILRDLSDLPLLDRSLFTVLAQELDVPLHIHIMLPRFSVEDLRLARRMTDRLRHLSPAATLSLHNWTAPGPLDLTVPLMNWGIEVASGRFVTLLQVGDLVSAGRFQTVLDRLRQGETVLVEGSLTHQTVAWWGDTVLPLASAADAGQARWFMIDRSRVQLRDLVFTSDRGDDTATFLASIGERYRTMRLPPGVPLGLRQVPQ